MTDDNVTDGFGPILQRIQERLSGIEAKLGQHDGRFDRLDMRFDALDKELSGLKLRYRYALGAASDVEMRAGEDADELRQQIQALTARVEALEPHDA